MGGAPCGRSFPWVELPIFLLYIHLAQVHMCYTYVDCMHERTGSP